MKAVDWSNRFLDTQWNCKIDFLLEVPIWYENIYFAFLNSFLLHYFFHSLSIFLSLFTPDFMVACNLWINLLTEFFYPKALRLNSFQALNISVMNIFRTVIFTFLSISSVWKADWSPLPFIIASAFDSNILFTAVNSSQTTVYVGEMIKSMKPIWLWETRVDSLSQSGENGIPSSRSASPLNY